MNKIRQKSGETIAEVLMASLVISLATILLVSMVAASFKLITTTEGSFRNYYRARNGVESLTKEEGDDYMQVSTPATGTITITIPQTGSSPKTITGSVTVYSATGNETPGQLFTFARYE